MEYYTAWDQVTKRKMNPCKKWYIDDNEIVQVVNDTNSMNNEFVQRLHIYKFTYTQCIDQKIEKVGQRKQISIRYHATSVGVAHEAHPEPHA